MKVARESRSHADSPARVKMIRPAQFRRRTLHPRAPSYGMTTKCQRCYAEMETTPRSICEDCYQDLADLRHTLNAFLAAELYALDMLEQRQRLWLNEPPAPGTPGLK